MNIQQNNTMQQQSKPISINDLIKTVEEKMRVFK
jgi:hypothetical protein